jgi:hypothetical protein
LLYSEQGFYYSFYHDAVAAPTWQDAYISFVADNRTEYPSTINALARFNVWPEAITALAYRSLSNTIQLDISPQDFYNTVLFLLAGIQWAGLYYVTANCTRNPFAGVVAVLLSTLLVGLSTRLPSQPALRENWALPWFWWHTAALARLLSEQVPSATGIAEQHRIAATAYVFTGLGMICSWQFTPFLLLLQLVAVFGCYVCNSITLPSMHTYLGINGSLLILGALVMGFNGMVATSLWACSLAVTTAVVHYLPSDRVLAHNLAQGFIIAVGALAMKTVLMLWFTDDKHVGNLIRAKLFGFEDLLTALYLCDGTYSGASAAEQGLGPWIGSGAIGLFIVVS